MVGAAKGPRRKHSRKGRIRKKGILRAYFKGCGERPRRRGGGEGLGAGERRTILIFYIYQNTTGIGFKYDTSHAIVYRRADTYPTHRSHPKSGVGSLQV